jgi:predicted dehydrogenase
MVRVGIIGAGVMGANHTRVYSLMKGVELVGVADMDAKRAETIAKQFKTRAYADYKEMFKDIEAVTIAASTEAHYALAKDALAAGLDVLLEKPITETVEQADELIQLADAAGRILMVGHVERFNPAIMELVHIAKNPVHIEARRFSPYDKRISNGIVLDLMVHDLEIIMDLVKSPIKSVKSMCVSVKPDSPTEDLASASIVFENGASASLIASRVHQNKIRELNIAQEGAYVTVDYMKQELMINRYVRADMVTEGEVAYRQEVITERPFLRYRGEPLWIELEHFISCCETRETPIVSGRKGRDVLETAIKIVAAGAV